MIRASLLKQIASRALSFSDQKIEAGQRATLERQSGVLYLSASDGNSAIRICRDDPGDNFETVINIYAFAELLNCFIADDIVYIEFDPASNKRMMLTSEDQSYTLPVYPTLDVYNVPKPGAWIPVSAHMNSVIQRARDWPIKHVRTAQNLPLVLMFDKGVAGIISGHISFIDEVEELLEAQMQLTQLAKVPDAITHYFLSSGHIYFNGSNEWCMVPLDSRKALAYKTLLDVMQKTNIYGIRINVSELLGITNKVRSMRKAEDILTPGVQQSIPTTFTISSITANTSLGSVTGFCSSNDSFVSIECKPGDLFYHAVGHKSFLGDNDEIEIRIGPQMSFIAAQVGTAKVLGGLYRT